MSPPLLCINDFQFKSSGLIVKNASSIAVKYKLGESSSVLLMPGKIQCPRNKECEEQLMSVVSADDESVVLLRTSVRISPQQLNLVLFYDANPATNRGKSFGFFHSVWKVPEKIYYDEVEKGRKLE